MRGQDIGCKGTQMLPLFSLNSIILFECLKSQTEELKVVWAGQLGARGVGCTDRGETEARD